MGMMMYTCERERGKEKMAPVFCYFLWSWLFCFSSAVMLLPWNSVDRCSVFCRCYCPTPLYHAPFCPRAARLRTEIKCRENRMCLCLFFFCLPQKFYFIHSAPVCSRYLQRWPPSHIGTDRVCVVVSALVSAFSVLVFRLAM